MIFNIMIVPIELPTNFYRETGGAYNWKLRMSEEEFVQRNNPPEKTVGYSDIPPEAQKRWKDKFDERARRGLIYTIRKYWGEKLNSSTTQYFLFDNDRKLVLVGQYATGAEGADPTWLHQYAKPFDP